jgi:hypothetical protein
MYSLLGLLIFGFVVFAVVAAWGLLNVWFLALPLGALCAVIIAAVWFNTAKKRS